MPEENSNTQNTSMPDNNQPTDDILDIPELPEQPKSISLSDIASPQPVKPTPSSIDSQAKPQSVPVQTQAQRPHSTLEQTVQKTPLKPSEQQVPIDTTPLPQTRDEAQLPIQRPSETKSTQAPQTSEDMPLPTPEDVQKKDLATAPEVEKEDKKIPRYKIFLIFLSFFIGAVILIYLFINFPALWSKISYRFFGSKENFKQEDIKQDKIVDSPDDDLLFLQTVYHYSPHKFLPSDLDEVVGYQHPETYFSHSNYGYNEISNNQIIINKIGVRAPVIWDVPTDDATLMDNLKHGIVHYKGTSKPGEPAQDGQGNVFLSGHSSYYWWDDGKYKTVFANLNNVDHQDEIIIRYNDYYFLYKVVDKKIINPDQVEVLSQNTDKPVLTLMTCHPVGTDAQRLIVTSELVGIGKPN